MVSDDGDRDRAAVKTYVPSYQKEEWKRHADGLEMTQSEFVRTMVQAGRRGFELSESRTTLDAEGDGADGTSQDETVPDRSLDDRIRSILGGRDCLSWDELLTELTDDVEARAEEALQDLQAADEVRYSGRDGGYTLVDE